MRNIYEANFWTLSTKSGSRSKAEQLQWRRSKVVEPRSRGMTHNEIARELHVSRTSITSDIQYLRNQAKESIREYTTDHLPEQYQVCPTALDETIKRAFDILVYWKPRLIIDPMSILSFDSLFPCFKDHLDLCHTSIYEQFNTCNIAAII
jgi:hypothetical protein